MTIAETLEMELLSPSVGARITGVDLRPPMAPEVAQALRDAFACHAVLCLSGQKVTAQQQIAFASLFGHVDAVNPTGKDPGVVRSKRGVMLVSNIRKDGAFIGVLPEGEMHFHSDGAHRATPYRATTLYAIKVPSIGGETRFAAMAAAYEALGAEMQERLAGLQARHVFNYNKTTRAEMRDDATAVAVHPLVRVHPDTGRRAIYVSRLMTRDVVGLEPAESDELLEYLLAHCERPDFVYAHRWAPGDLVIWDNRCVNHARTDFPAHETRLLRRYTVSEPA